MINLTVSPPFILLLDGFHRHIALRLSACLFLLFCGFAPSSAQITRVESEHPQSQPRSQPEPAIVVAAATDSGVRFTAAAGAVVEIRLEVFSNAGQTLFDSDFRRGNIVDWRVGAHPQASAELQGDSVLFVVTVRTLSGRLRQLHGWATIPDSGQGTGPSGRFQLHRAAREDLSPAQAQAWEMSRQALGLQAANALEPEAREGFAILEEDPAAPLQPQAATLAAHDGQDGQLTSTSGALTFRTGHLFSGKDVERVRITPDGNVGIGTDKPAATLDVAGTIRATGALRPSGGIEFSDGTVLTSTGNAARLNANGQVTPAATGSGSQDRIAKWIDNAGTLGDTRISEVNGSVVVGDVGQTGNLQIFGTPLQDVFAGMGQDVNVGPAFNYGYAGLSFGRGAGFFNVRPDALATPPNPSLRFMTANVERMIVTNTGGVGIGTTNPSAKLDVVGSIRASGSLTGGSGIVAGNLTVNTNTLHVDAATNRVGVGTITPGVPLDVVGDINTSTRYNIGGSRVLSNAGSLNLFAGVGAGAMNTGSRNSFFGADGGVSNTTGTSNSFFGAEAGSSNTSGNSNSFFGSGAGFGNTTATGNSFFGYSAGQSNSTGNQNSFFGERAGQQNTASSNSFFGGTAGAFTTTGASNSFFGSAAGSANTTGASNSFFGSNAGTANTASNNSFFGASAGAANTSGAGNSFFGKSAGAVNVTGFNNSFFGSEAGAVNTGSNNSFFGKSAGTVNTTGGSNSFFGNHAGDVNTSGINNSFFGDGAGGANTTSSFSSYFGAAAGINSTGSFNSFFGHHAGWLSTSGASNAFFGESAGENNTMGGSNTFIGRSAGLSNTTEANNTFIGANSNGFEGITNASAIGANAIVTQSDSLVLGNGVKVGAGTSTPKEKLHVLGGNILIDGVATNNNGLILKSPDGLTCAKLTIDNAGALVTTVITCP